MCSPPVQDQSGPTAVRPQPRHPGRQRAAARRHAAHAIDARGGVALRAAAHPNPLPRFLTRRREKHSGSSQGLLLRNLTAPTLNPIMQVPVSSERRGVGRKFVINKLRAMRDSGGMILGRSQFGGEGGIRGLSLNIIIDICNCSVLFNTSNPAVIVRACRPARFTSYLHCAGLAFKFHIYGTHAEWRNAKKDQKENGIM
jgi:hypothetical protein